MTCVEANVFRVASMILGQRYRQEARRLLSVGDAYFATNPSEQVPPAEVIRQGWVLSLPRLRELLEARLHS